MKKLIAFLAVFMAIAGVARADYYSHCEVSINAEDDGVEYARADNGDRPGTYAEAKSNANTCTLGSRIKGDWGIGGDPLNAGMTWYALSEFAQDFEVMGVGSASVSFAFDGTIAIGGDFEGTYQMGYEWQIKQGESQMGDAHYEDSLGLYSYEETPVLELEFNQWDVGNIRTVEASLKTFFWTDGRIDFIEGDWIDFEADFFNSFKIDSFSEGLMPTTAIVPDVPIPSAVWLLGSGLIGLVGVRRKLRKEV